MIQVRVEKQEENITAFHIEGHAEYSQYGLDIICSAVSALAINCVNSIEELTDDVYSLQCEEERGMLDFCVKGTSSEEAQLLLQSMVIGLNGISESYGKQYVTVEIVRRKKP